MEMRFSGPKILSTIAIVVIAGFAVIGAVGVHLFVIPKNGIAHAQTLNRSDRSPASPRAHRV